jgi:hypothetical protein
MSSNALESQGMVLKRGDGGSPETFTAIPEITSISGPGGSAPIIDTTDLDSTAREKRLGLADEGQVSLDINYIPANAVHAGLRSDRANRSERNFQLIFTDSPATTWSFAAFVPGFQINNEVDGVTKASVTLEVTGAITES